MSLLRRCAWRLLTLGAIALPAACASAEPGPPLAPTPTVQMPATSSPRVPAAETSVAVRSRLDSSRALSTISSSPPAQSRPKQAASRDASPESESVAPTPTPLRLPTAEDLGPNYFELFAGRTDARASVGDVGQISAAVVAFGFSERAKLRDERIVRDGPLAAVARVSRHSSSESAVRFAAAGGTADGRDIAVIWPGLAVELRQSRVSTHSYAPGLTATRTLHSGWFSALDGSRIPTVVEQWTAVRARTVLTVNLVWGSQVTTDGWGLSLLRRLARIPVGQAASHAP